MSARVRIASAAQTLVRIWIIRPRAPPYLPIIFNGHWVEICPPNKCPLSRGIWAFVQYMVPWTDTSLLPKQHFDRFIVLAGLAAVPNTHGR